MSGRTTPAPAVKTEVPEVLAGVTVPADEIKKLREQLAAATAKAKEAKTAAAAAKAAEVKKPTAREFVRKVDLLILGSVGDLLAGAEIPEELLPEVRQLLANQLHHLSSPERGWHGELPKPARSEWR